MPLILLLQRVCAVIGSMFLTLFHAHIATLMQPHEDVIHCLLIPALTGRAPPNEFERDLLALPPR